MVEITLSADELAAAPSDVRRWLEQRTVSAIGEVPTVHPVIRPKPPFVVTHHEVKEGATESTPFSAKPHARTEQPDTVSKQTAAVGSASVKKLIAKRAYELWEDQGRPHGCDLIHWRQAEREIMCRMAHASLRHGDEQQH